MNERNDKSISFLNSAFTMSSCLAKKKAPALTGGPSDRRKSMFETGKRCLTKGGLRLRGYCKQSLKNKPLISIITVVFNGAECLERTILSIINQTYDNIEYVIIDGGSSDNTINIIEKYENQIDYWISEPDDGIFDAMNKGIDLATGDWLNFVNAGDQYISKNTLADAVTRLDNGDCYYGFGYQEKLDVGGKTYLRQRTPSSIHYNMPTCHNAMFFPKNRNIKYDKKYRICADFAYYREYMRQGYKLRVNDTPVIVWTRGGFSDDNRFKNIRDRIWINLKYGVKPDFVKFVWCFLKQLAGFGLMTIIPHKLINILRKLVGSEYVEIDTSDQKDVFDHWQN